MQVVLHAGFDVYSGYGNDAVDMAIALDKAGVQVTPMPSALMPGLPRAFTRLLEPDPRGTKDAVIRFAPPGQCDVLETGKMSRKTVAYTMWERTPFRREDVADMPLWKDRPFTFGGWDALWVTCTMNLAAFDGFVPEHLPVEVIPCGIEPRRFPQVERDWYDDRFQFLSWGMLAGRKNPFALLEAWHELKQERPDFLATLRLHSLAPGLHPGIAEYYGPDIEFTNTPLSPGEVQQMIGESHVYVSTSRGEGNNKPAMEFMSSGGLVMATEWAGHQNWLHPDAAVPLTGELVPAKDAPGSWEFEVDRTVLKQQMYAAWQDRPTAKRKAELGARFIREGLSWEHVVDKMIRSLGRLL